MYELKIMKKINNLLALTSLLLILSLTSCGLYKKTDARKTPVDALERAKVNIKEGKGMSIQNFSESLRSPGKFEFSSSNPLWRATIETLDFLPLANADYSGGIITTDWYSDNNSEESIKITVRFLSNEISSTSVKVIVHQKNCKNINSCTTKILDSKINQDLTKSILSKAAKLEKTLKK